MGHTIDDRNFGGFKDQTSKIKLSHPPPSQFTTQHFFHINHRIEQLLLKHTISNKTQNTIIMRIDDLLIAVAYFSIPLQLVASLSYYPRLVQMPPKILGVMILFALFVWCCGFGHFLRCGGYTNKYVFQILNWITAVISILTAIGEWIDH